MRGVLLLFFILSVFACGPENEPRVEGERTPTVPKAIPPSPDVTAYAPTPTAVSDDIFDGCFAVVWLKGMTEDLDAEMMASLGPTFAVDMVTTGNDMLDGIGLYIAETMQQLGGDSSWESYDTLMAGYEQYLTACEALGF